MNYSNYLFIIVAEVDMASGFTNPRTGGESQQVWWHYPRI